MMKKVLSFAIIAVSMISMPSFAQDKAEASCCKEQKECKEKADGKKCCKQERESMLFQGMNLTDEQKSRVKDLNAKYKADRKKATEICKEQCKDNKDGKACDKDSKANMRKEMKQKQIESRREYLKEMKQILGADNYVIFLENQFVVSSQSHDRQKMNGPKHGKGKKEGAKSDKTPMSKEKKKMKMATDKVKVN